MIFLPRLWHGQLYHVFSIPVLSPVSRLGMHLYILKELTPSCTSPPLCACCRGSRPGCRATMWTNHTVSSLSTQLAHSSYDCTSNDTATSASSSKTNSTGAGLVALQHIPRIHLLLLLLVLHGATMFIFLEGRSGRNFSVTLILHLSENL